MSVLIKFNNINFNLKYKNFIKKYIINNFFIFSKTRRLPYTIFKLFLFFNNYFFKIQIISNNNIYKNINNLSIMKLNFFLNNLIIQKKKIIQDILLFLKKKNIICIFFKQENTFVYKLLIKLKYIFFNLMWIRHLAASDSTIINIILKLKTI